MTTWFNFSRPWSGRYLAVYLGLSWRTETIESFLLFPVEWVRSFTQVCESWGDYDHVHKISDAEMLQMPWEFCGGWIEFENLFRFYLPRSYGVRSLVLRDISSTDAVVKQGCQPLLGHDSSIVQYLYRIS